MNPTEQVDAIKYVEQVAAIKYALTEMRENMIIEQLPKWIVEITAFLEENRQTFTLGNPISNEVMKAAQAYVTSVVNGLRILYANLSSSFTLEYEPLTTVDSVPQSVRASCVHDLRTAEEQLFEHYNMLLTYYASRGNLESKIEKYPNAPSYATALKVQEIKHFNYLYFLLRVARDNALDVHTTLLKNAAALNTTGNPNTNHYT